ncbi:DUF998 domain-containing protein [Catellatospora sp. KI3]|uniref:DUF998 domain-containing protein n=1 Tax=Catellatospora sp. KI3 TaxID=3041620 RepID=UPI00248251A4|nr:DUF998 domain-containing protein [Catellatospora sp. KI3]MDI1465230.1 DUF998 domain-containing protein [Catellatospora sp. KI3]
MTATATTSITSPAVSTRVLLGCAAVAAPLWAAVSLGQAAARDGFDLTRHPLSMLSNGSLGWLQIANFIVGGLLTVIGAAGLRLVLTSRWAPRLIALNGLGMIAAGVFVMDAADGFPAGTPSGMPAALSWHSYAHFGSGTIAFAALIAACYVLGRGYRRAGDRGGAVASYAAGTAALVGNLWAVSGGRAGSLALAVGVIAAMLWISVVAARLLSTR